MKLITFLACIMMGLSIWSVTSHAQTANAEPAVNPPSADSFPQAKDCPACKALMNESKGCQVGYHGSDCQRIYDGKKGEEKAVEMKDLVK